MAKNTKQTSAEVASLASDALRDETASKTKKSLAGSALAQRNTDKQTGAAMEDKASKVLQSDKYADETKSLAGSLVSQANKKR